MCRMTETLFGGTDVHLRLSFFVRVWYSGHGVLYVHTRAALIEVWSSWLYLFHLSRSPGFAVLFPPSPLSSFSSEERSPGHSAP